MSDMTMPAIAFKQGKRQMYLVVDDPRALVQTFIADRKDLDPRDKDSIGNRRLDAAHRRGIAKYLEEEEEYVIGAAVLYTKPGAVRFAPVGPSANGLAQLGELRIPIGTRFHVGDGQHRMKAYEDVLKDRDEDDQVFRRIVRSGQPAIIVEEDRGWKMALDFVDLGHNAKPLTSSLGFALDVRQAINRLALDLAMDLDVLEYVTQEGTIEKAGRIEFQGNAVGKGSAKLYTFASWRFAVATYLLGFDTRDKRKIQRETNEMLVEDSSFKSMLSEMKTAFAAASRKLPGWQKLLIEPNTYSAKTFRDASVLGTSAGLTALAFALKAAKDAGVSSNDAAARMAKLNWSKGAVDEKPPFFSHTIIVGGKVLSSRTNFEPAGHDLARVVRGDDPATVMGERRNAFVESLEETKQNLDSLVS
jgi:DNA sulfur modification protein DndB